MTIILPEKWKDYQIKYSQFVDENSVVIIDEELFNKPPAISETESTGWEAFRYWMGF